MNNNRDENVAIVQGEFHLSSKDVNQLINRELEEWDAILIEGREPVYSLENAKFGFWYYAIGAIFTRTLVGLIHEGKAKLRIANNNPWDSADIDVNKRIDANHREIWSFTNEWIRWGSLLLAAVASLWALINPNFLKNWNNVFFATYHSILFSPCYCILLQSSTQRIPEKGMRLCIILSWIMRRNRDITGY